MNRADIEHYESPLVITVAQALLPPGRAWDTLPHRSKQRYLDRAVIVVGRLLDSPACQDRFRFHALQAMKQPPAARPAVRPRGPA